MIQLSGYGLALSFTIQDLRELGELGEECLSKSIKFIQKEIKETGIKLSDLIDSNDIKSFVENSIQKSTDGMIEYVHGTIENKLTEARKK